MAEEDLDWGFPRGTGSLRLNPWVIPTKVQGGLNAHRKKILRWEPCEQCGKQVPVRAATRPGPWRVCSGSCYNKLKWKAKVAKQRTSHQPSVRCQVCGMERVTSMKLLARTRVCPGSCKHFIDRLNAQVKADRAKYEREQGPK